ncbi:MAG: hypothetical protein AAF625_03390, partial [Pseudomonadota bacterium]
QADARPEDLNLGAVFGAGLGLIASQILNLVLSSAKPQDTAEVSGLNGTFEQLGNAIGVALVGTIMLSSLASALDRQIHEATYLTEAQQAVASEAMSTSIQLVSDTQIAGKLTEAGASEDAVSRIVGAYAEARINSFRIGIGFLVFLAMLGLIFTRRLPNHKLVAP